MAVFTSPYGSFELLRFPPEHHPSLRAWDAADAYVLDYLVQQERMQTGRAHLLLVEDGFGALTLALHAFHPTVIADSFLSHEAIRQNAAHHQLAADAFTLRSPLDALDGVYDVVVLKIPKAHAYLEDVLMRVRSHLNAETLFIGAGMARHIHTSTLDAFERLIGPTRTSLARQKARLIFATVSTGVLPAEPSVPTTYGLENTPYTIFNYANVFSRDKLDQGTRFLLQYMPHRPRAEVIVDVGCGSGVLALIATVKHPKATIHAVDASFMATASAQATLAHNMPDAEPERFRCSTGDGLAGFRPGTADLILCNPPFHQHHATGDHIALRMFDQAHRALKSSGELWIVANRHLGYQSKLNRCFHCVRSVAQSRKFTIWQAVKG